MDTRAILRNLKSKGIAETIKIARRRRSQPETDPKVMMAELFLEVMDRGITHLEKAENKDERKKMSAIMRKILPQQKSIVKC